MRRWERQNQFPAKEIRECRSSALCVCLLSFKSVGELPPEMAAFLHRGGIRFTFDGHNSNTGHRRQTVVEVFRSPQVSARKREGKAHPKSNVNGIEESCGELLKEPKGAAACSAAAATGLLPSGAGHKPPRTGRRGTEIL